MGLANTPQQFQEMVDWVLCDVRVMGNSGTDAYMDDILVGTRVGEGEDLLEVHDQDLRRVLEVLKEHKLVADKKSVICLFGRWNFAVKCWLTGQEDPCRESCGRWKIGKGQGPSPS